MNRSIEEDKHHPGEKICPVYEMDMFDSFWAQVRVRYNGYHTTEGAKKRKCLKCFRVFKPRRQEHICCQCNRLKRST